jgi:hypothetical protein
VILNNAPQHEAVLSNVGEIGEFRIRNSAKAFSILSSGLYANKIRAIIRELSCNAVDSHTAAGRQEVPFDVHLPNQLDPTFRIRDYGTGLSHEQVLNIYTTYFESTKTESNQFIGALGLGSKSPFSYTDNFTVTAIQNGQRNVYSAFINGEGVPSVALMHSETTDQPNGVEVQFAVTDRYDFDKFRSEAREVYTYFRLRPVVGGGEREFEFRDVQYKEKNIIPGVHYLDGSRASRAVMGNISYPIDVPNAESNLGQLARLLNCGLEMHFDIGELDFQASREGLSYIPSTIEAIKTKLVALEAQLAVHLAMEADAIHNAWEKALFLIRQHSDTLWKEAARAYAVNHPLALVDTTNSYYMNAAKQTIDVKDLAARYNISILAFSKSRNGATCHDIKPEKIYKDKSYATWDEQWSFPVDVHTIFVKNDLKVGALSRAKYHWRNAQSKGIELPNKGYQHNVYVMSPATKGHAMDVAGFLAEISNPPASQILLSSDLLDKPRKDSASGGMGANVTIMSMQKRGYGGYHRERELVWKDAGKITEFCDTNTYYYLPLKGFEVQTTDVPISNMQTFTSMVTESGIPGLQGIGIYGVRKTDIDYIRKQKNWVNLQDHIRAVLAKLDPKIVKQCALKQIDANKYFRYNNDIAKLVDSNSPYSKFLAQFKGLENVKVERHSLERLSRDYATPVDVDTVVQGLTDEFTAIRNRYPLLSSLRDYDINALAVAEYITLIDTQKGI